jgi:hypothetical protein
MTLAFCQAAGDKLLSSAQKDPTWNPKTSLAPYLCPRSLRWNISTRRLGGPF